MAEVDKKAIIELAAKFYKNGFYEKTIELCESIINIDGRYMTAYYGLAKSLIKLDKYGEALEVYNRASLIRESKELHNLRGDLYFLLERYSNAYQDYCLAKGLGYNKRVISQKISLASNTDLQEDLMRIARTRIMQEYPLYIAKLRIIQNCPIISIKNREQGAYKYAMNGEEQRTYEYAMDEEEQDAYEYIDKDAQEEYEEELSTHREMYWSIYFMHHGPTTSSYEGYGDDFSDEGYSDDFSDEGFDDEED